MVNSGLRIREIRKNRKESGISIAQILCISPQYYYDIEKGKRNLSTEIATKLANHFSVSVDYLLGRTDDLNKYILNQNREESTQGLTPKEERDIATDLKSMLSSLEGDEALAFLGEPLDDETKELMRISLESSMRLGKQMAKKKFTPKKYK